MDVRIEEEPDYNRCHLGVRSESRMVGSLFPYPFLDRDETLRPTVHMREVCEVFVASLGACAKFADFQIDSFAKEGRPPGVSHKKENLCKKHVKYV